MKIIIHAGMHKTGTSSIQHALRDHAPENILYPRTPTGNHSRLFAILFDDPSQPGLAESGQDLSQMAPLRRQLARQLEAELGAGRHDLMIFSSEFLTIADPRALIRMRDFLSRFSQDIQVIAYVRPPIPWLPSHFQQLLRRDRISRFDLSGLWPDYQSRLGRLDSVFGRENVILRKFDPPALKGGDVVRDFADFARIALPWDKTARVNESLSLEATALLYMQRRFGIGWPKGFHGAARDNNAFIAALARLGSRRLHFAPHPTRLVLAAHHDDLDWLERRMDQPMRTSPPDPATGTPLIGSEGDLLAVARENEAALAALLHDLIRAPDQTPRKTMLRNLEYLRRMSAQATPRVIPPRSDP